MNVPRALANKAAALRSPSSLPSPLTAAGQRAHWAPLQGKRAMPVGQRRGRGTTCMAEGTATAGKDEGKTEIPRTQTLLLMRSLSPQAGGSLLCFGRHLAQGFDLTPLRSQVQADKYSWELQEGTGLASTNHPQHSSTSLRVEASPLRPRNVQRPRRKPYPQRVVLAARDQASGCGLQRRDRLLVGAGHGVGELTHDDVAAAEHGGGRDAASARGSCGKTQS